MERQNYGAAENEKRMKSSKDSFLNENAMAKGGNEDKERGVRKFQFDQIALEKGGE